MKKIKRFVAIFPKDDNDDMNENYEEFYDISEDVIRKRISSKPQKLLISLSEIIQESLRNMSTDTIYTLSHRLRKENKESSTEDIESAENINNLLLKMMDSIKNADEEERSVFRKQLFLYSLRGKIMQRLKERKTGQLILMKHESFKMN